MKKIFIGTIVPPDIVDKMERISFASINYQTKVLKATHFDEVYNILPLNVDRISKKIFFEDGMCYLHNKYLNSKLLKLLFDQIFLFRKVEEKSKIIFYNITIQNFLLTRLLVFFKKCECYAIVADFEDEENYLGLRKIVQKNINRTFKKLSGAIILSSNIQIPTKSIVLEGIVDSEMNQLSQNRIEENSIIFSGSIGYTTGIHIAVAAMNFLPDYKLYISGPLFVLDSTDLKRLVKSSVHNNVYYMGILDNEKYLELLSICNYALNLRDPHKLEHQHNFPSKILEYLMYNKNVISTLNYSAVSKCITLTEFDAEKLAATIKNTSNAPNKNSRDYVLDKFGLPTFNNAIETLLIK